MAYALKRFRVILIFVTKKSAGVSESNLILRHVKNSLNSWNHYVLNSVNLDLLFFFSEITDQGSMMAVLPVPIFPLAITIFMDASSSLRFQVSRI